MGGSAELQAEIQQYLYENGIKKFASKHKIINGNIADNIVQNYPTVAHANIRIYGNTAVLMLAEAESNLVSAKRNIYAKYDAVIKEIYVGSGIARVTVGDVVKKGDLLVENGYADKVIVMGEVYFPMQETFVIIDMNIV
jgi:similar to stage IV sporulation protein